MTGDRPVILVFLGRYLPGYKAGGALRTIANMAGALSDDFDFRIVTTDRDSGDTEPYPSVEPGIWQAVGPATVLYLAPESLTLSRCREILETTPHDAVYLQSCFSPFTWKPLVASMLGRRGSKESVIVAPRGELYPGALGIKPLKKFFYLILARVCRFYSGVVWQASNADEAAAIRKWFGSRVSVVIAPDLARFEQEHSGTREPKVPRRLRAVFLSRICPKKNLRGALTLLRSVKGDVVLDVIGPAEDAVYWNNCQKLIGTLPANVIVTWCGPIAHERIPGKLAHYDLLLFPTLGENFGHVILESLLAGCPVLISDRTPWRDLQRIGAGWDLPLNDSIALSQALQDCVDMDEPEHSRMRRRAREFASACANDSDTLDKNRQLLARMTKLRDLAGSGMA